MSYEVITDGYHIDKSHRVRLIDAKDHCIEDIPGITQQQMIHHIKELSSKYPITRRTDNIYSYDGRLMVSITKHIESIK